MSPSILAFHKLEHKEFHPFFIKPKTLSSLALLLFILNLLARSEFLASLASELTPQSGNIIGSPKSRGAIFGTVFAYLCFASIHFPNTIMIRPHPIFWRVVLGIFSCSTRYFTRCESIQQSQFSHASNL